MTRARTQLDKERLSKKQESDAQNYLDAVTQTDEAKAADAVIEAQKTAEKATKEDEIKKIEELEKSRQFTRREYIHKLATVANDLLQQADIPPGYTYWIRHGKEKMDVIITTPDGRKFGRGIKPVGITQYDFHAVGVLMTQCENTIDQLEERGAYRKDGIILPS